MSGISQKMFWKRRGWVEIENQSHQMVKYDGYDFKFSGTKVANYVAGKFNVSILGLSGETINELATWNIADYAKNPRRIDVYAGYDCENITRPIFSGRIFYAIPTNPPEMWINFVCLPWYGSDYLIENNVSYEDEPLDEIASNIAQILGLKWDSENWKSKLDKTQNGSMNFSGPLKNLPLAFSQKFGVSMYVDDDNNGSNNVLYVCDKRPWLANPNGAIEMSQDTSMLAATNVDMRGAIIKRRLDNSIKLNEWVHLTSKIFEKASGDYVVIRRKHTGHLRGEDWYTELETVRFGANV